MPMLHSIKVMTMTSMNSGEFSFVGEDDAVVVCVVAVCTEDLL